MKTEQVKRGLIVALIVIGGIAGLFIDNGLEESAPWFGSDDSVDDAPACVSPYPATR
jgi:hypothetical protein